MRNWGRYVYVRRWRLHWWTPETYQWPAKKARAVRESLVPRRTSHGMHRRSPLLVGRPINSKSKRVPRQGLLADDFACRVGWEPDRSSELGCHDQGPPSSPELTLSVPARPVGHIPDAGLDLFRFCIGNAVAR
jgi:hypothetical protein